MDKGPRVKDEEPKGLIAILEGQRAGGAKGKGRNGLRTSQHQPLELDKSRRMSHAIDITVSHRHYTLHAKPYILKYYDSGIKDVFTQGLVFTGQP